ncbi:hypothetical protein Unana1_00242 [Umbelopsis nana]
MVVIVDSDDKNVDVASSNISNEDGASNLAESMESRKRKTTLGGIPKRSFAPTVTSRTEEVAKMVVEPQPTLGGNPKQTSEEDDDSWGRPEEIVCANDSG